MNGTNFAGGTTSLTRVGYESQQGNTGRAFWRMGFNTNMHGATIDSATFKVLNTHSWSCLTRPIEMWATGGIDNTTTWNKQPSWLTHQQTVWFANGYGSGCADNYVQFSVKNAVQQASDKYWPNLTLGMRANNEADTQTWRLFQANTAS